MPTNDYNFDDRARVPVRPLSFENKDLAIINEVIIDYNNGDIYIKKTNGEIIVAGIMQAVESIKTYITNNPDLISNIKIRYPNSEQDVTIEEAFALLDKMHTDLSDTVTKNKTITDNAMQDLLTSVNQSITNLETTMSDNYAKKNHNHDSTYFKKSGGTISGNATVNGTSTFKGKIILSSESYGTELPATGTEGQLFFKIIEE